MVSVSEQTLGNIVYTNISLTRGDDCTLVLPIYTVAADGTRTEYTPQVSDTFAITVRVAPVETSGTTPTVVFNGSTSVVDGKLNWTISHSNSTQNCGKYYWDAQITTGGKIYTFYQGTLNITPEVTT